MSDLKYYNTSNENGNKGCFYIFINISGKGLPCDMETVLFSLSTSDDAPMQKLLNNHCGWCLIWRLVALCFLTSSGQREKDRLMKKQQMS